METRPNIKAIAGQLLEKLRVVALKSGEKHDRILDAALELMAQYGFRKTTVDEIAEKAGVAKGTVYLYFRDKQDIMLSIIRRKMSQFLGTMINELGDADEIPSKMKRVMGKLIEYHRQDLIINRILTQDPDLVVPVLTGMIAQIEEIVRDLIAALLRVGIAEGSIAHDIDVEMTAMILFRLNQITILRIKTGEEVDGERYLDAIEKLVFHGIRKKE